MAAGGVADGPGRNPVRVLPRRCDVPAGLEAAPRSGTAAEPLVEPDGRVCRDLRPGVDGGWRMAAVARPKISWQWWRTGMVGCGGYVVGTEATLC